MRVMWLNYGLLPDACAAMGYKPDCGGGWLPSMLSALLAVEPSLEICVASLDWRRCDVVVGNVRYVSFGGPRIKFTYDRIPERVQKEVGGIISQFNPDVIHVHGTEYYFGCFAPEVYCGKPVVVSIQGLLSGIHPHYMGGISPRELRGTNWNARFFIKGRTLLSEQTTWREGRAVQEQEVIRQQQNFIGRTAWDRDVIQFYNQHARYFVVNENLRAPFFTTRRNAGAVKRHSIYCGAAASTAFKGAHWLIRAVAALQGDFPDIELRIAAADGLHEPKGLKARMMNQSYHAYVRRLIRMLGVERHIVALPILSAEEVAEELSRAELFVLPSMCENSPNSLGEAMLVGTPSIATFVGGVPSVLKDGIEGKLVPPGDPAALAGAIRRWFLHPEEAEACVEPARQTALKRHDAKANAEATLAVYESLTND